MKKLTIISFSSLHITCVGTGEGAGDGSGDGSGVGSGVGSPSALINLFPVSGSNVNGPVGLNGSISNSTKKKKNLKILVYLFIIIIIIIDFINRDKRSIFIFFVSITNYKI